jgi:hypothetical protein
MKQPFKDGEFDAVYEIDATCHAPDQIGCYKVSFLCSWVDWICYDMLPGQASYQTRGRGFWWKDAVL